MARRLERLSPDALGIVMAARPQLAASTTSALGAFDELVTNATDIELDRQRRARRKPSGSLKNAVRDVEDMYDRAKEEGENVWTEAKPRHLVGLYAKLHESVYGVLPIEVDGVAFAGAVSAARTMLDREFEGDVLKMLGFMRWVWSRERWREADRRRRGGEGRDYRVGWRLQFASRALFTDWRVALMREHRGRHDRRAR